MSTFRELLDESTEAVPVCILHTATNRLWYAYRDDAACGMPDAYIVKPTRRGTPHVMPFLTIAAVFVFMLVDA